MVAHKRKLVVVSGGEDLHHRLKRRKMKKSWLHATLEEPLKKAASAAFYPIMITDSLENLHLKSLVVNKMKSQMFLEV